MYKQLVLNCILGVCLLGFAAPAGADLVVNIDVQGTQFGGSVTDYTGASANGPIASDNTWNYFNVGTTVPDTQSLSAGGLTFTFGTGGWQGSFADGAPNNLQGDRVFTFNGQVGTMTISGLDITKDYNLALISGSNIDVGFDTDFTIGGTTKNASSAPISGSGDGALTFVEGDSHVLFSGLDGSSGSITFSMTNSLIGTNGVLSGLQIQEVSAVPEPTSLALFGLASLAMVVRRRRG